MHWEENWCKNTVHKLGSGYKVANMISLKDILCGDPELLFFEVRMILKTNVTRTNKMVANTCVCIHVENISL